MRGHDQQGSNVPSTMYCVPVASSSAVGAQQGTVPSRATEQLVIQPPLLVRELLRTQPWQSNGRAIGPLDRLTDISRSCNRVLCPSGQGDPRHTLGGPGHARGELR